MVGIQPWGQSDGTEVDLWEDDSTAVLRTVGKLIKFLRERAGLTQAELGEAIGYGEEQVSSVERGRRAAKEPFLNAADEILKARGMLSALNQDVEQVRYPKKVRDVAKIEAEAVEIGCYEDRVIDGFRLLRMQDGSTVGLNEIQLISRVISEPKDVHIFEMRYGLLRAQALSPDES